MPDWWLNPKRTQKMTRDPFIDDTCKPLPMEAQTTAEIPRQELIDLLREMSLSFATDARRVGAPGSDARLCCALRSAACGQAARMLSEGNNCG